MTGGVRKMSNFSIRKRDVETLTSGRGAKPDPLYPEIITKFRDSGDGAWDLLDTGKSEKALRQGLNMALQRMTDDAGEPLSKQFLISLLKDGDEQVVVISRRDAAGAAYLKGKRGSKGK